MKQNYKLIEIKKDFWIIEEPMVRSFLLIGTEKTLLIDSGCMLTDIKSIVEGLTRLPVILANTHADPDHINCNTQFDTIYMNPSEYAKYHNFTDRNDNLRPLWDGDLIDIGGKILKVILNPGHTSGCITFLDEKNHMIIGGDSIQNGTMYMFGEERDLLACVHSLDRIMEKYGDKVDYVFPSHAQCPVPADIMSELRDGMKRMLNNEFTGKPESYEGLPIRVFDIGCATVLYEGEKEFFEK